MKIIYLSSVLMLLSAHGWGKSTNHTKQSLTSIMTEARDPYFKSADRIKYLQIVHTSMQKILAKELSTSPTNLSKQFIEDPKKMDLLWASPWIELQTEFYTTLHQEVLNQRWNEKLQKKKVSNYGKYLTEAMIYHLSKYSGTKEGRLYNRWNNLKIDSQNQTKNHRVPLFVFSNSTKSLLSLGAHTSYEQLFPKEGQETLTNPSLSTFLNKTGKKSREEYQALAEKIQLNHRIYIRAVANAAKTIASIHYLTGEFSLPQTESKVASFIYGFCDGCSKKEKDDYRKSAISYVVKKKKELSQEYRGSKDIVTSFCKDLKHNGYLFDEPVKEKPVGPFKYEIPTMAIDNTRVDRTSIHTKISMMKMEAVRKTVAEHDLGILFLTNNLSRLNEVTKRPSGTYLDCTPASLASDTMSVRNSIAEARKNVELYISVINQKISVSSLNSHSPTETLEYFTQTNVSATAEAVMTFPQGISHVVESVLELDHDTRKRKRIDKIVVWGGTIVGIGLTISGVGAPEGLAILLAVGAMTKGAISGVYHLYRSNEEKAFFKQLSITKSGLGSNFYLDENLSAAYDTYRDLRMNYILDFAGSAFSFVNIHRLALTRTAGNVTKAHGVLKNCFNKAKAIAEDIGIEELESLVITTAI